MRSFVDEGTFLTPPIGSISGVDSYRGPLTAATVIVPSDGTILFDAGGAAGGVLTQPLPSPAAFSSALRIVSVTTNNNILSLTTSDGVQISRLGEAPSTVLTLGLLASGAEFQQVLLVAADAQTWQVIEGMQNVGAKIPYGPLSQRGTLPDGASYIANDVLAGVLYQEQGGAPKAIGVVPVSPVPLSLPAIGGDANAGSVLTVQVGTWQGTPVPVLSHQWMRDGVDLTDSGSIAAGSQSTAYTVQSGDLGHVISVREIATNANGSAATTTAGRSVFQHASGLPAASIPLLSSGGTALGHGLVIAAGTTATGPANAPFIRCPTTSPIAAPATQASETPGIRLYLHNWAQMTPIQPWFINADGTLFGAKQGVLGGSPPAFPVQSFALGSLVAGHASDPSQGFLTGGGLLWVVGVGYVSYQVYNPSTGVFSGCDTRYSGAPAGGAAVYQVTLPRVEPGNMNLGGGTSYGQLNIRVPGVPTFGVLAAATRIALQPLVTAETGGFTVSALAWMV